MAATIKTKIRTTTGGTPSTTAGELCVNTADKKIFIGNGSASVDLFGNLATTAGKLSQFAATTSAELAGVVSDETGSGSLVFGTSPSISTLEISTTGASNKAAGINMASGITSGTTVNSYITLNGYSGAGPTTYQGVITSGPNHGYELKLYGQGVAFIGINGDTMYLGDVGGDGNGGVISFDGAVGSVELNASTLFIVTTTPEVGKVLTCMDGSGTASWQTPAAGTPDYVLFNLGII